jgi:hypothetical protein
MDNLKKLKKCTYINPVLPTLVLDEILITNIQSQLNVPSIFSNIDLHLIYMFYFENYVNVTTYSLGYANFFSFGDKLFLL